MTSETRGTLIFGTLLLSAAVHVGIMALARPQVMTHVSQVALRMARRAPMQMRAKAVRPESVKLEAVRDLKALKDAPEAAAREHEPSVVGNSPVEAAKAALKAAAPALEQLSALDPSLAAPKFDAKPIFIEKSESAFRLPREPIDVPRPSAPLAAPESKTLAPFAAPAAGPALPALSAPGLDAASLFLPARLEEPSAHARTAAFIPSEDVYDKVDARVVEEEKQAVRALLNQSRAESANKPDKFVQVGLTATTEGKWTYFRLIIAPRHELEIVPKDVVILIDGSGSIGNDRLGSCRKAAQRILRTCTNSGDRFNLVVFRNRFTYAFRNWRFCDAPSFAAADGWLARQTSHGRTDVFSTIASVLTLPRDPARPLIALVVTDGDANVGVSDTAEMLSRFTALNDGLVSVYMYGVKSSANRELIDVLTQGNRGESFIFEGWRWNAGNGIEQLSERFRDPVLSDLRLVFSAATPVEAYPQLLRNLYAGGDVTVCGRVPADCREVSFSLRGLNGRTAHGGVFKLPLPPTGADETLVSDWRAARDVGEKLKGSSGQ